MTKTYSEWTSFLNHSFQDPYHMFKEKIAVQLEENISKITLELLNSSPNYTPEIAKKMAVNIVMQQLLAIQYDNSPETQKAMVINLFTELPSTMDFKIELFEHYKKKNSLFFKIKEKIKKRKN